MIQSRQTCQPSFPYLDEKWLKSDLLPHSSLDKALLLLMERVFSFPKGFMVLDTDGWWEGKSCWGWELSRTLAICRVYRPCRWDTDAFWLDALRHLTSLRGTSSCPKAVSARQNTSCCLVWISKGVFRSVGKNTDRNGLKQAEETLMQVCWQLAA